MNRTPLPDARPYRACRSGPFDLPLLPAALALALFCPGCGEDEGGGEDKGRLSATIQASTLEGPAPLDVAFELVVSGAKDEMRCTWDFGDGHQATGCALSHVFAQAASEPYLVRAAVEELNTERKAAANPVTIAVHERADLEVSGVVVAPHEITAGDPLTVSFQVRNRGGMAAPPTTVCVTMVLDDASMVEVELGRLEVGELEPGGSQSFASEVLQTRPGMRGGLYDLVVEADCSEPEVVAELSEDNNAASPEAQIHVSALTTGPDLVVRELAVSPTTVLTHLGERQPEVNIGMKIVNIGNELARAFGWQIYLSASEELDPDAASLIASGELAGLGAGRNEPIQERVLLSPDLAEGAYHIFARVDPADDVRGELDEFNNDVRLEAPLQVLAGSVPGFDLILTSIRIQNFQIPMGGSLDVAFTLCNRGTFAIPGNFFVTIFLSKDSTYDEATDPKVGNVNLLGLEAQSCIDGRLTKMLPPTLELGAYRVGIVADPANAVDEADEENNTIWHPTPVTVGQHVVIDLAVGEASFAPSEIEAGDLLTVAFSLQNLSAQRSAAFVTAIVLSPDDEITPQDRRLKLVTTPFLNGGATARLEELVPIPLDVDSRVPVWYIGVLVDPDDEVPGEPDEGNNVALAPGSLTITGGQGGCQEDLSEPNDTFEDAAQISVGLNEGLGRCGNDDWFGIEVQQGESLSVTLTQDAARGNLDLELYAADGMTLLDASATLADTEHVAAVLVPLTSLYYIRVTAAGRGVEANYTLQVELAEPVDGVDLQIDAVQAAPAIVLQGQELELGFDVLNFGLQEAGPSRARAWLSSDGTLDEGDTVLVDVDVPSVPGLGRVHLEALPVPPHGLAAGSYVVLVAADADREVAEQDEQNNVAGSASVQYQVPEDCADDGLEPNNVCRMAVSIEPGVLEDLVVCDHFDDWYALDLEQGDCVTLSILFANRDGDLDLEVLRPGCLEVERGSHTSNDRETVDFCATQEGTYFAHVNFFSGAAGFNGYRLEYDRVRCVPDRFEPNETVEQAREVSMAGEAGLSTCGGDQDHYLLRLLAGQQVTIRAAVLDGLPLTLSLYTYVLPPGTPAFLGAHRDALVYTPAQSGLYLLKVRQMENGVTQYDLIFEGLEGLDLRAVASAAQPSAVLAGGLTEVAGTLENSRIQALGPFGWAFWLSVDEQFDPAADWLLAQGRAVGLAAEARLELRERVELPGDLQPGSYHVLLVADPDGEVAEVDEGNNVVTAGVTVELPCHADLQEPNDSVQQPTALALDGLAEGTICRGDVDWFVVDVPPDSPPLTIRLEHQALLGDLDLFVYGPPDGSVLLGRSATAEDVEQVALQQPAAGPTFVRVQALGGAENSYSLTVQAGQR